MKFRLLSSKPDKIDKESLKNALGFFMNQFLPGPWVSYWDRCEF